MSADNSFTPPYTSVRSLHELVNLPHLRSVKQPITPDVLRDNGVSAGNVFPMMSALRSLRMIDEGGYVINSDFYQLYDANPERKAAFDRILKGTYGKLLEAVELENATVVDIEEYFVLQGISVHVAAKASRFFMWVAAQAGYEVGVQFVPYKRREQSPTTAIVRAETVDEIQETLASGVDPYEERYLEVLLKRMESVDDMEAMLEIAKMVDDVLQRREARLQGNSRKANY